MCKVLFVCFILRIVSIFYDAFILIIEYTLSINHAYVFLSPIEYILDNEDKTAKNIETILKMKRTNKTLHTNIVS